MRRHVILPRHDWRSKVEELGFDYHSMGQDPSLPGEGQDGAFWHEGACYEFTSDQVDALEGATEELNRLCLAAVDRACSDPGLLEPFRIPPSWRDYVLESWTRGDPHLMGRFDLAYDPASGAIKMIEFNADTPTLAIETGLVQWFWLQETHPDADQFNSLHERLLGRLGEIRAKMPPGTPMHFAAFAEAREDFQHSRYFMDLAMQAGIDARFIDVSDIGWDSRERQFVDLEGGRIRYLHKLYPWEHVAAEPFAEHFPGSGLGTVEPPWKMVLSNKALLPLLWRLFPGHPNLLPAFHEPGPLGDAYAAKPILSRGGENVRIVRPGRTTVSTGGSYGDQPLIYQALAEVPEIDGQKVIVGSWVVGNAAAGMILRESERDIVVDGSRVVPHFFR